MKKTPKKKPPVPNITKAREPVLEDSDFEIKQSEEFITHMERKTHHIRSINELEETKAGLHAFQVRKSMTLNGDRMFFPKGPSTSARKSRLSRPSTSDDEDKVVKKSDSFDKAQTGAVALALELFAQTGNGSDPYTSRKGRLHDDLDLKKHSAKSGFSIPSYTSMQTPTNSWEQWWIRAAVWKRRNIFLLLILFLVAIMQLATGIYLIIGGTIDQNGVIPFKDLQLCSTANCQRLAAWLKTSRNENVNPCENFYEFMCGTHTTVDVGDLYEFWYQNFARIESGGETILPNLIKNDDTVLARKVLKYYQVCMGVMTDPEKKINLDKELSYLIKMVLGEWDIWETNFDKYPTLEDVAARLISFLGDYGLFVVKEPISSFIRVDTFVYLSYIYEKNVGEYLPIIYNALNIMDLWERKEISKWLFYMASKAELIGSPHIKSLSIPKDPDCMLSADNIDRSADLPIFNLYLPFELAWNKRDKGEKLNRMTATTDIRVVGHKNESHDSIEIFHKNWNCIVRKIPKRYVRPVYAVFWSLRIFIELVHDVDNRTAEEQGMLNEDNPFFTELRRKFIFRLPESRCFYSLEDNMGYYPIFRYFESRNISWEKHIEVIRNTIFVASEMLNQKFRPAEEGGLPWISTYYRERVYDIIHHVKNVQILFPIRDGDDLFLKLNRSLPSVGNHHVENIFKWRQYTTMRTYHYIRNSSQVRKDQLVWDFYLLDIVNAYEFPSSSDQQDWLMIPPSVFEEPFWFNDILSANFAGTWTLLFKSLMKLLSFDYRPINIDMELEFTRHGRIPSDYREGFYREGVLSDGDFKYCEALTYNWNYLELGRPNVTQERHKVTALNPHSLSFRFGSNVTDLSLKSTLKLYSGNGIFPNYISIRTAFHEKKRRERNLRDTFFLNLTMMERNHVIHSKLIDHENFTMDQLFFMFVFRDVCRSPEDADKLHNLISENLSAIMQMDEFQSTFNCPIASSMNPPNQCFSGYSTDGYETHVHIELDKSIKNKTKKAKEKRIFMDITT